GLDQSFDKKLHMATGLLLHGPEIYFFCQMGKGGGGFAARIGLDDGALLSDCTAQILIERHDAHEVERDVEKTLTDHGYLVEQLTAFLYAAAHVGDDVKTFDAMIAAEQLDKGVGIGNGGGF